MHKFHVSYPAFHIPLSRPPDPISDSVYIVHMRRIEMICESKVVKSSFIFENFMKLFQRSFLRNSCGDIFEEISDKMKKVLFEENSRQDSASHFIIITSYHDLSPVCLSS